LVKFKTSNHHLPIEVGRWCGIPLADRTCTLSDTGKLANEFHFILECGAISTLRKEFLAPRYCRAPHVAHHIKSLFNTPIMAQ
jgi:hypothetical protein